VLPWINGRVATTTARVGRSVHDCSPDRSVVQVRTSFIVLSFISVDRLTASSSTALHASTALCPSRGALERAGQEVNVEGRVLDAALPGEVAVALAPVGVSLEELVGDVL